MFIHNTYLTQCLRCRGALDKNILNECSSLHSIIPHWVNLNYLLFSQLGNNISYLLILASASLQVPIFPISTFKSHPKVYILYAAFPDSVLQQSLVLHLGCLRAFITSCLMLKLFVQASWLSVKNYKLLGIGKHVSHILEAWFLLLCIFCNVVPTKDVWITHTGIHW